MSVPSTNSSSTPIYLDGTSSAIELPCTESTAPSGNAASILRNWTILVPGLVDSARDRSDVTKPQTCRVP